MSAMAVLLLVMGMCVHGSQALVCEKDFKEKGCNRTVEELFTADMFEAMFNHRNDRVSHAQNFWTYDGFMSAAKMFEKDGFGSVGGDDMQKRELAAFFAHVAHETSCGWSGAKDGPYAWGLCYNQEMAPEKDYCKTGDLMYPCTAGVGYYGRGAFPLYWNYNYGPTGVALKQDLLNHPEILSQNETIAWQAAVWYWMTPAKTRPSPHQIMTNKWVPNKVDTLAERKPGFGMTINIKTGDVECGHGDDPRMQSRISHYLYFLQGYFGVQDPGENLGCGLQGVIPLAYASL
jgi:hypothetical protein